MLIITPDGRVRFGVARMKRTTQVALFLSIAEEPRKAGEEVSFKEPVLDLCAIVFTTKEQVDSLIKCAEHVKQLLDNPTERKDL